MIPNVNLFTKECLPEHIDIILATCHKKGYTIEDITAQDGKLKITISKTDRIRCKKLTRNKYSYSSE